MKTRIRKDIERIVGNAGFDIANTELEEELANQEEGE